jgi:hypothetical protein
VLFIAGVVLRKYIAAALKSRAMNVPDIVSYLMRYPQVNQPRTDATPGLMLIGRASPIWPQQQRARCFEHESHEKARRTRNIFSY